MATYTITIKDQSNKTKHLVGLIKELAKIEKANITIEHVPNAETIEALKDSEAGRVTKSNNKKDFFDKLNH